MKQKLFLIFMLLINYCESENGLLLKKVFVFGRHSLRGPLSENIVSLTPKVRIATSGYYLSSKGALLENYMGEYFSAWLYDKGLFQNLCPESNSVYIYSNYLNRTRESAQAFTQSAFPNCRISLHFKNVTFPNPQYDSVFPFLIRNATDAYQQLGAREMRENLNKLNFTDAYERLNIISDIQHSEICKYETICDLTRGKEEVVFKFGEPPHLSGRFKIAYWLVDAFLMAFYEGFPLNEVGWGETESDWKVLIKISNEELNICYNLTTTREFIRPLVKRIKQIIEDDTLFTLIVGHDSNLSPLMLTLGFKPYLLPEQFESIPIGSKLVFQKWTNGTNDFLKVEFMYQSWRQIRDAERLSLSNPPKNVTLYFEKYNADENGMYLWSDFKKILDDLIL